MSVEKRIKYDMQGGVRNYLGKQKTVSDVPVKWQSGPDKPATELAYITKAEKDLLLKKDIHGSLKKGPNEGPGGIMSLDSAGDKDGPVGGYSGADVSAAETGKAVKGMSARDLAGFRAGAISAGARAGLNETQAVKDQVKALRDKYGPRIGTPSPFGPKNILSGILGALTGPIGFATNLGTMFGDSLQNLREKLTGYSTQDDYEKARQDRINQNRIDNILNRDAPITDMTISNLEKLGYTGDMPAVGSTPTSRAIARDLAINPETTQFARSYIQSLAQPNIDRFSNTIAPMGVNVPNATRDITFGDVPRGFNYLDVSDEDLYGTRSVAPSPFSTGYKGIAPMGIQGIDVDLPGNDLMAEITQKDIDRFKQPMTQMMDYDTYKSINPDSTVTPDEFNQLKAQV